MIAIINLFSWEYNRLKTGRRENDQDGAGKKRFES